MFLLCCVILDCILDIVNAIWILLYFFEECYFFLKQTINLIGLKLWTLSLWIARILALFFVIHLLLWKPPLTYMVQVLYREFGVPFFWFYPFQNYPLIFQWLWLPWALSFCSSGQKNCRFSFKDLASSVVTILNCP